jgi:hypothetical protein
MRATRNLALIPKENPPEQVKDLTRTPQKNSIVTREAKRKVKKKTKIVVPLQNLQESQRKLSQKH